MYAAEKHLPLSVASSPLAAISPTSVSGEVNLPSLSLIADCLTFLFSDCHPHPVNLRQNGYGPELSSVISSFLAIASNFGFKATRPSLLLFWIVAAVSYTLSVAPYTFLTP